MLRKNCVKQTLCAEVALPAGQSVLRQLGHLVLRCSDVSGYVPFVLRNPRALVLPSLGPGLFCT